jgi:hypothetical protein
MGQIANCILSFHCTLWGRIQTLVDRVSWLILVELSYRFGAFSHILMLALYPVKFNGHLVQVYVAYYPMMASIGLMIALVTIKLPKFVWWMSKAAKIFRSRACIHRHELIAIGGSECERMIFDLTHWMTILAALLLGALAISLCLRLIYHLISSLSLWIWSLWMGFIILAESWQVP